MELSVNPVDANPGESIESGPMILKEAEGRREFTRMMKDAVNCQIIERMPLSPGVDPAYPTVVLPRPPGLPAEIEWTAAEVALGLHSFVTLRFEPGGAHMSFVLCVVDPVGRKFAELFANTTRRGGGKYNAGPARFNLMFREGEEGVRAIRDAVSLAMPGVGMLLVTTMLMPQEAIQRYAVDDCPWCGTRRRGGGDPGPRRPERR